MCIQSNLSYRTTLVYSQTCFIGHPLCIQSNLFYRTPHVYTVKSGLAIMCYRTGLTVMWSDKTGLTMIWDANKTGLTVIVVRIEQ